MSTDAEPYRAALSRVSPVSRVSPTVVPAGITDPVERARAELKAALAAIEVKANVPRRVAEAAESRLASMRRFARDEPVVTAVAVVAVAAAVGAAVWGVVRAVAR